ncbi:MAG: PKD domain-containing protein, partial [Bacteroidia bacterium]
NYAIVLEDPPHCTHQQPYFNVVMLDQNNDTIPYCGNYVAVAGTQTAGAGWNKIANDTDGNVCYWLPWTASYVSLKKYIGQCVTVIVTTSDCGQGGHFGYAYFTAKCQTLGIITSSPSFCGSPIKLTAPSGGLTYSWTGPCVVGSATSQTITVGCAGKYTVVITTVAGASCADTLDTIIASSTASAPVPNFKSDTVCQGIATQFTNLTTGGSAGNIYSWNFGSPPGGTSDTSSKANPTFTYPAVGTYTATLSSSSGGCGGDTAFPVVVTGPPTAAFTALPVCQKATMGFTNTSTGSTVFKWNFGDGSTSTAPSPSHTYAACGTYNVVLVAGTPPCIDSAKETVTVYPLPTLAFTANPKCFGQTTVFTNSSTISCAGVVGANTITAWSWNFGDPGSGANNTSTLQNPTHTFTDSVPYNVLLIATSNEGCKDTISQPVDIVGNPVANFTSGPVCLGQQTLFTDLSTGSPTSYNWTFGDGNTSTDPDPVNTYTATGTYNVELTVSSGAGCTSDTTIKVVVNPNPTANFSATTVCQGTATIFTDKSAGETSWSWNFGDGSGKSTQQNPTYIYADTGIYQVKEIVSTASGCKDSITIPDTVHANPKAIITVPPICISNPPSTFILIPTDMGATGTYSWAFGDGTGTSTVQNPTYTYAAPGAYNVTVALTSAYGCLGSANVTAVVYSNPVADFVAPTVCQGKTTVFNSSSSKSASGVINTWAWSFGDGGTSTSQNPTHIYATCDTFNVTLGVASDSGGCTGDTTIKVIVNPVPVPNFTSNNVCQGLATNFTNSSTIGCSGTITTWSWNFGDGNTSADTNPVHTYSAAGIYNVSLTVTSNSGCDSTITLPVTVYPIPVPQFSSTYPCLGNATVFTSTSSVAGGIAGYGWIFGDGGTLKTTADTCSHLYAAAGTYPVTLIVVSTEGCVDSITHNAVVNPNPFPLFTADTAGCTLPFCTTFHGNDSIVPPSDIAKWSWNLGNGVSTSNDSVHNCYSVPGLYSVELTVTTDSGCTGTINKPNYIDAWPIPVAKFTANPNPTVLVNNPTVVFNNASTGTPPLTYDWVTFGDGLDSTAITENAVHTYIDTGTFNVVMVVTNKYGCVDTAIEPVVVQPVWTFYVPNAFTPNGDGLNDGFIGKGVNILTYEMWIFDRWGMLLYHCTSMSEPWNGTVQGGSGGICQEDTYVWLIDITDVFHNQHRYIGRVTLIK